MRFNINPIGSRWHLSLKHKIRAWRHIAIARPLVKTICYFIAFRKRIELRNSSKDIQIMLLTIGFPRSGSSLLGYLLTAHPNMVVADEALHSEQKVRIYSNLDQIFNQILEHDYNMQLRSHVWQKLKKTLFNVISTRHRIERYILIHNQYQGHFEQLKVIGNKSSHVDLPNLSTDTLKILKKSLKEKNIVLKWIFTVRNPYDIYSTMMRHHHPRDELIEICVQNKGLLKQIDSQDIFYAKYEDMVANPHLQLAKVCDFLQVPASPDYLDDCASVVYKKAHKSRLKHDWTMDEKQTIESLIEKYDFFSGYDWDT